MVPLPEEFTYEFWLSGPNDVCSTVVTCFMPNGITILLNTRYDTTFAEIKEDLWIEAQQNALYGLLHDMSVYVFQFINSMAEMEKVMDEWKRLCDIRPTGHVLIIKECSADETDNSHISQLIGKRLQDFDALSSAEVNQFRFKMRKFGEDTAKDRQQLTWEQKLMYYYSPRIGIPNTITKQKFMVSIKIDKDKSFSFNVPRDMYPEKLLQICLDKRASNLNIHDVYVEKYVLKVFGQNEYIIGSYPLIEYQYIQEELLKDAYPVLVLVNKADLISTIAGDDVVDVYSYEKRGGNHTLRKKNKNKSAWDIKETFKVTLGTICRINCDVKRNIEIGVQARIFHGGKSLCEAQKIPEHVIEDHCEFEINKTLDFKIEVCNIPKNAKLCFVVYETTKKSGTKSRRLPNKDSYINPVAWANTTIYDFKNALRTDAMSLYMWNSAEDMMNLNDDIFHPLGTVVSNPDTKYATTLTLQFEKYTEQTVIYPSVESMINLGRQNEEPPTQELIEKYEQLTKVIFENDSLEEVHDQERKSIWKSRRYWMKEFPGILPKLLHCVDWESNKEISEVVAILKEWPKIPVEKSLELLDYAYANEEVRSFAVKCLNDLSDDDILLYLLQLVQAIKHELFLDCDLVMFLLKRSFKNRKIGHYLFWHLRSEMQVPSVSVRFGLILEAYCRGSPHHMNDLYKQLLCLEKLKSSSEIVKKHSNKEKGKSALQDKLTEEHNPIHNFISPIDPKFRCKRIKVEKCRVMDSKMKPLWIVFENTDYNADDIYIIFKNGDDLRQDMLTLQMIRIMDKLWKNAGLDLRMNPYNCISMDNRLGMIEVVLNAETIANIQKEKGTFSATSAFRKGSLLAWLKDHNSTESQLKKAINEFTLSCAGYCVATYVLGVADRHSDNIMIKKTGQLFHIDFGHILGHFKEKFGFKRERVPFVLTHDFVHVISKGQKTLEFKLFQKYCEEAFTILRQHGSLIISLFAMMISTGLPELSSEKDLNYLKETLVLSMSEKDALAHFRSKFDEALSNSWKTSVNWATHNLAKNNKV
nr:phosphatidylinositol 4,5-bisphosphate 3-kinase catalytic subunit delta isoform [Onthophagus taurus]XP_022907621.1 phosphatidylinositol 4,5-bisphosphate 3-kinase catalytic subunit delta isoform [Onthophagus taurus]